MVPNQEDIARHTMATALWFTGGKRRLLKTDLHSTLEAAECTRFQVVTLHEAKARRNDMRHFREENSSMVESKLQPNPQFRRCRLCCASIPSTPTGILSSPLANLRLRSHLRKPISVLNCYQHQPLMRPNFMLYKCS